MDSYPGLTFRGQVSEVQLSPTVSNNVVTYGVVLEVANVPRPKAAPVRAGAPATARYRVPGQPVYRGEMALFPGMTANVAILTVDRKAMLRVPNRALRFTPDLPGAPPGDRIWILEQGAPKAVPVTVGVSGPVHRGARARHPGGDERAHGHGRGHSRGGRARPGGHGGTAPMILEFLQLALFSLTRNQPRAFLTMLGIIIGVGAVIAMIGIGKGAKQASIAIIRNMGSNMLIIFNGGGHQQPHGAHGPGRRWRCCRKGIRA